MINLSYICNAENSLIVFKLQTQNHNVKKKKKKQQNHRIKEGRRMKRPSNDLHKNNFSSLRLQSSLFTVRMILPFIQLIQYHGPISFAFHSSWPVNVSLNKSIIVTILLYFFCMWQACHLFTCFLSSIRK